MEQAVIEAVWIGEADPDLGSRLIQWFINKKYSHNGFIFEGKLWHATTPGGVRVDDPEKALDGCVIRYRKTIPLTVTREFFRGWLEGELGKVYSYTQNVGLMLKFTRFVFKNGDAERNCSEFLARACKWSEYKFDDNDWVTPADTEHIIKPEKCG